MFRNNNFITKPKAFTIIELLVVMAIAGILMAALAAVFSANRRSMKIVMQSQEIEENARAAVSMISADLQSAFSSRIITFDNSVTLNSPVNTNKLTGTDAIGLFTPLTVQNSFAIDTSPGISIDINAKSISLPVSVLNTIPAVLSRLQAGDLSLLTFNCINRGDSCVHSIDPDSSSTSSATITSKKLSFTTPRWISTSTGCGTTALAMQRCIAVGDSSIYYVRDRDPALVASATNTGSITPQLVKFSTSTGKNETVANNVLDMQINYGYNRNNTIDWANNSASISDNDLTADANNIRVARVSLIVISDLPKATGPDQTISALINSAVDYTQVPASRLKRLITTTIRVRNNDQ